MRRETIEERLRRLKKVAECRKSIQDWLLEQPWDQFVHITFRKPAYQDRAQAIVFDFFERLNRPSDIFYVNFIKGFFVFEKFKEHDDVHVHALIWRIPPELDAMLEARCNARFGRSEVRAFNSALAEKCCKYLADSCCFDEPNWLRRTINSRYRPNPQSKGKNVQWALPIEHPQEP